MDQVGWRILVRVLQFDYMLLGIGSSFVYPIDEWLFVSDDEQSAVEHSNSTKVACVTY